MKNKLTKKDGLALDCAVIQCKLFAVYQKDPDYYNNENLERWQHRFKTNPIYAYKHLGNHITISDLEHIRDLLIEQYDELSDEDKLIYEII